MVDKSAEDTAWRLANLAKKKAPYASGDLMESIKFKKLKNALWQVYIGTPLHNKPKGRTYPFMQERGYKEHLVPVGRLDPKARTRYGLDDVSPYVKLKVRRFTPFMYPALMQTRGDSEKIITKRINQLIDKAARKSNAYMK